LDDLRNPIDPAGAESVKTVLAVFSLAMALAGPALASDLPTTKGPAPPPPPPVFSWTGFFGGLNAGYGWIDDHGSPLCVNSSGVPDGAGCDTNNVPGAQVHPSGFIGGGQIGYNWQLSPLWVVGVEADCQGADISDSINIAGPFPQTGGGSSGAANFVASERMDWFGTVRPRVGVVWNQALIYATGGLAYGHISVSDNTIFPGLTYPASDSATRFGWTLGGGVEYAIDTHWSVKVEGLYYDLGSVSILGGPEPAGTGYLGGKTFDTNGGIVRAGLNYKFF
jgi:outer membrane immunogenic protein